MRVIKETKKGTLLKITVVTIIALSLANCGGSSGNPPNVDSPSDLTSIGKVIAISAGGNHSLALQDDGTVWAWGDNSSGELGDGTTNSTSVPQRIEGLDSVTHISAGFCMSVALKNDGTVWQWGCLLDGDVSTPQQVTGLSGVVEIRAGSNFTLALKTDGTVWSWGDNTDYQLGDGTQTPSSVPVQVMLMEEVPMVNIVSIEAGDGNSVAIAYNGQVFGWGLDMNNVFATALIDDPICSLWCTEPVSLDDYFGAEKVSLGGFGLLSLKADGALYAAGNNENGALGIGTNSSTTTSSEVIGSGDYTDISAGQDFGIAIKRDGSPWGWGYNIQGCLGIGTNSNVNYPVLISGLSNVTHISAGRNFVLALTRDGKLWSWGSNSFGALGNGTTTDSNVPVEITSVKQ